jgi:hypothetical protein
MKLTVGEAQTLDRSQPTLVQPESGAAIPAV